MSQSGEHRPTSPDAPAQASGPTSGWSTRSTSSTSRTRIGRQGVVGLLRGLPAARTGPARPTEQPSTNGAPATGRDPAGAAAAGDRPTPTRPRRRAPTGRPRTSRRAHEAGRRRRDARPTPASRRRRPQAPPSRPSTGAEAVAAQGPGRPRRHATWRPASPSRPRPACGRSRPSCSSTTASSSTTTCSAVAAARSRSPT